MNVVKAGLITLVPLLLVSCVTGGRSGERAKLPYNRANVMKAARMCHAQVVAVDSSYISLNGFYPAADTDRWAACLTSKLQLPDGSTFAILLD